MNYPYLNLARREYSDIPYHINSYLDGEKHFIIEGHDWNKNKHPINVTTIDVFKNNCIHKYI